jgi:methylated-DNA-[protein]-cysteine S-methyltransferase
MGFYEKVWKQCSKIPKGKVSTYKKIANSLGTTAYRAVGTALSNNPYAPTVPCHRVVNSNGSLGGFMGEKTHPKKQMLLEKEGIEIVDNRILNFKCKLFKFQ